MGMIQHGSAVMMPTEIARNVLRPMKTAGNNCYDMDISVQNIPAQCNLRGIFDNYETRKMLTLYKVVTITYIIIIIVASIPISHRFVSSGTGGLEGDRWMVGVDPGHKCFCLQQPLSCHHLYNLRPCVLSSQSALYRL